MKGQFGSFGGRYVAETLQEPLAQLAAAYDRTRRQPRFQRELREYLTTYGGRPTPLYRCRRLTSNLHGATIWLKREDLLHGGAHKFNNTMGQALLARRLGKKRVIAETGAGQHGVATAIAAAVLGLDAEVYMGRVDMERQRPNVTRMELLGAKVRPVTSGSRTLKDAINEALRDWVASVRTTHYLVGSVVGPDPYPRMVRDFQSVIGEELRRQTRAAGFAPDALVACVGGGSNAAGTFAPWIGEPGTRLIGVEAGGDGARHSASLSRGRPGILHGARSYLLADAEGQIEETHSISAGLDYPGVGPEHSHWKDAGFVQYATASDSEALAAYRALARTEGILPALESAHAVAYAMRLAKRSPRHSKIVVTLSGRGDKDLQTVTDLRQGPA